MKKTYLTLVIILTIAGIAHSQQIVRIDFYNQSTGDYDLMILNSLRENGYEAYVEYGPFESNREYDLRLVYQTTSREGYDELHKYEIYIFDKNDLRVNKVEKVISYINFGINEPKELCKATSKVFSAKWNCNSQTETEEVKYFNISFNIHKIDSAVYSITAKGAGIRPLKDVKNAFLKKANQYLDNFEYYIESSEYGYSASGGTITTHHTGFAVYGIIQPSLIKNLGSKEMIIKPVLFDTEFN
jgi:hypothetical protein